MRARQAQISLRCRNILPTGIAWELATKCVSSPLGKTNSQASSRLTIRATFPCHCWGQSALLAIRRKRLGQHIAAGLQSGNFLRRPSVAVQVIAYRPIFVLGEVNKPGMYPYQPGMTMLTAVAIAGGFTYRAVEDYAADVRTVSGHAVQGKIGPEFLPGTGRRGQSLRAPLLIVRRRTLLAGLGAALTARSAAATPLPVGLEGPARLIKDWTFGSTRPGATVRSMSDLRQDFRFRYIYDHGRLDGLPTSWSRYRDYPEGDPRSVHVFTADRLILKASIAPDGGLRPGGIEAGMLRALLPVTTGMLVEMRARLPRGLGVWPAFWLNPGVEYPDGQFSVLPWPPEIDIFEFFVWQHRTRPEIMECNVQVNGDPAKYGNPHDTFSLFANGEYNPGIDFSAGFHVFALDWRRDLPTWYLDGRKIKQTYYEWGDAPPAHILVTNQIGMTLKGVDLTGMRDEGSGWDYTLDYLRVWSRE